MQAGDHFVSGSGLMVVIGLQYTVGLDCCEFLHMWSPWDACLSGEIPVSMGTKPSPVLDKKLNTAGLLTSLMPPRHSERELVESRKLSHIYPSLFVLLSAASTKTQHGQPRPHPLSVWSQLLCLEVDSNGSIPPSLFPFCFLLETKEAKSSRFTLIKLLKLTMGWLRFRR